MTGGLRLARYLGAWSDKTTDFIYEASGIEPELRSSCSRSSGVKRKENGAGRGDLVSCRVLMGVAPADQYSHVLKHVPSLLKSRIIRLNILRPTAPFIFAITIPFFDMQLFHASDEPSCELLLLIIYIYIYVYIYIYMLCGLHNVDPRHIESLHEA